jgi:hypothetical protein
MANPDVQNLGDSIRQGALKVRTANVQCAMLTLSALGLSVAAGNPIG